MPLTIINQFKGEFRFLSNFYEAEVLVEGLSFPTAEHAYQAMKTVSLREKEEIRRANTPGVAKRLGRKVTLRPYWEDLKLGIMYNILVEKFTQNVALKEQLLSTGDVKLIEGNSWGDRFWGEVEGEGENWLGKLLMQVRDHLGELKIPVLEVSLDQ